MSNKQSISKEQKRKQAEAALAERMKSRASRGAIKVARTLSNRARRIAKDEKQKLDAANKRFAKDKKRPIADANHARAKSFIPPFSASHGHSDSHIALVRELKNREARMFTLEARVHTDEHTMAKLKEAA